MVHLKSSRNKTGKDGLLKCSQQAMEQRNARPWRLKARRVGGANYQVPSELDRKDVELSDFDGLLSSQDSVLKERWLKDLRMS